MHRSLQNCPLVSCQTESSVIMYYCMIFVCFLSLETVSASVSPTPIDYKDVTTEGDKKKVLDRWEAVFFNSNNQKVEYENMFARKIFDSENDLYMSWLPLKLVSVGGDIRALQTRNRIKDESPVVKILKTLKRKSKG